MRVSAITHNKRKNVLMLICSFILCLMIALFYKIHNGFDFCINDYVYRIEKSEATIIGYRGTEKTAVIPSKLFLWKIKKKCGLEMAIA